MALYKRYKLTMAILVLTNIGVMVTRGDERQRGRGGRDGS